MNSIVVIFLLLLFGLTIFLSGCVEKETSYGIGTGGFVKKERWVIPGTE